MDVTTKITLCKESCIDFLMEEGVIEKMMLCPGPMINGKRNTYCGKEMLLRTVKDRVDGKTWRCRKVHKVIKGEMMYTVKDVKVSIRNQSWIEYSKLTLEEIIMFIYLWSTGYTCSKIMHELSFTKRTVTEWSWFCRETCMAAMLQNCNKIGGPGIEVEIDESKFGRRKYYKGKRVKGQWIMGGREKYDKSKVFMVPVEDRSAKTLIPLIQRWIEKGSIIHSDCWKAYSSLRRCGYKHLTVNHSKTFKDKKSGACTNKIESDWRHAKVSMPRYGVKKGYHASYLAEFMWRRKNQDEDKFMCLIKDLNTMYKRKMITSCPVDV